MLSVLRGEQTLSIPITTAHRPGRAETVAPEVSNTAVARRQGHGLRVAAVDPRWLQQLGIAEPALGVAAVDPGSAADDAGIRRGDIILRVDGAPPMSPAAVDYAARDRRVTLLVRRGEQQLFIPLVID